MDAPLALQLIRRYTQGWLKSDFRAILDTLDEDCEIVESHGPVYRGKAHVEGWLEGWRQSGSTVGKWDIAAFVYSDAVAAFEWDFECVTRGIGYSIRGMSLVEFRNEKICSIREYRMTDPPYTAHATYI